MDSHPHLFVNDFPGVDCRKVDMSTINRSKAPEDWRQLSFYRSYGPISTDLPNLHACAHLYACDRNSLFIISNSVGFGDEVGLMNSLSLSVIFHGSSQDLYLNEEDWWCQEAWTSTSGGGRGTHESRIWRQDEMLIATTWQDALVRKEKNEAVLEKRRAWVDNIKKTGMINETLYEVLKRSKL